jgi:hypothetical protein
LDSGQKRKKRAGWEKKGLLGLFIRMRFDYLSGEMLKHYWSRIHHK